MAYTPDFRAGAARGFAQTGTVDAGLRAYMLRVYNWMTSGLLLTGIIAYAVSNTSLRDAFYHIVPTAMGERLQPTALGFVSMFAPLGFVMVLSFGVNRLSRGTAQALYWAFCAAMGASLASLFFVYAGESIARVFFITAATFAATSIWGYTTKQDLSRAGGFLFMGLIGVVIASVVNMFVMSSALQFVVSVIGVLVFTGLTAYDTQRIRATYTQFVSYAGQDEADKRSVYDALSLYLNFINLFMMLLQLTGNRNSSS
jgi:uncharacterized protein